MKRFTAGNCLIATALMATLLVGGCKKKKPQPQVAQAPPISASQMPSAAQTQPKTDSSGTTNPQITTTHPAAQAQAQNHPATPRRKPKKAAKETPPVAPKKSTSEAADAHEPTPPVTIAQNNPPKITIEPSYPDGSGGSGAISATAPHSDDVHNKLSTEQLLQSTEDNLKSIKRALSLDEQSQVSQIRNFMAQSRSATAGSDSVRARNLALKAHLLSDELVRQR
jgi:hypothetical protein